MKTNLPTFLISMNPMARPDSLFLTHTKNPFFVAEVKEFSNLSDCLEYEAKLNIGGRTQYDNKYYVIEPAFIIQEGEQAQDMQARADKLAKLFRRAADWLHAALKEMDNSKT